MRWNLVPLGECCEIVSGGTPSRSHPEYFGGTIAWATPKDLSALNSPILDDTPEHLTENGLKKSSAKLMPKGSVLFSSRAPIGLVAIAGREMCTNQGFKSLIPSKEVHSTYLYHCMKKVAPQIAALGNGATFKEVSKRVVTKFSIPLPPLAEQKRIAAILDKADAIRRKRRRALELADEFLRSVFLDMFGDPVVNPMGWEVRPLGEIFNSIIGGWSASGEARKKKEGEKAVLKISAVTSGRFKSDEYKVVPELPENKKLIVPQKGDLLFSRANTRELVAATCIVEKDYPDLFLPDKLWKITPRQTSASAEYIKFLLTHPRFRDVLTRQATGTSGSMLNISKQKLINTLAPVPPIHLQNDFSSLYWKNDSTRQQIDDSITQSETLFTSLSQRAFRGEL